MLLSLGIAQAAIAGDLAREGTSTVSTDTPDPSTYKVTGDEAEKAAESVGRITEEEAEDETVESDAEKGTTEVQAPGDPVHKALVDMDPFRVGDTWTYYIEVTVPAGAVAYWPQVRDRYLLAGVDYVPGSTTLTSVSGTPTTGASFRGSSEPTITSTNSNAEWTWLLANPIDNSSSATDYVFRITYDVQYTGVRPNGTQELGPNAGPDYMMGSRAWMEWSNNPGSMTPNRDRTSDPVFVELVQPFLSLDKTSLWLFANWEPGFGYFGPPLPGQYFPVIIDIYNTGGDNPGPAYDISISDVLPSTLEEPMVIDATLQRFAGPAESLMSSGAAKPSADGLELVWDDDVVLYPGDSMTIAYWVWGTDASSVPTAAINVADVDWSTMPGDVEGERVFDDQSWEAGWTDDTDTAMSWIGRDQTYQMRIDHDVADGETYVYKVGDTVEYDITASNPGTMTIPWVAIWNQFNGGFLDLQSVEPSNGATYSDPFIEWDDFAQGPLAPGESATVRTSHVATNPRSVVFSRAFISKSVSPAVTEAYIQDMVDEGDKSFSHVLDIFPPLESNLGIVRIAIFDPGDLQLEKYADPVQGTIMLPGETITYSVDFGNFGPDMPAAVISDEIPDGAVYVPGSISLTRGGMTSSITDDPSDGDNGGIDAGEVFVDLGDYSQDETGTLSFEVTVDDVENSAQGIANTADLTLDNVPAVTSNQVIHPVDPFVITKTGEDINGGLLVPGDEILWTITVTNTGITPTTNVMVYDTVPQYTTYVADSITGQGADDSGDPDLEWNVGTMQIDETQVLTFKSSVDAGTPNGTEIRNQAAVESDQSFLTFSDSPTTAEVGDATLLQTGQNDWVWLVAALVALVGGGVMIERYRKRGSSTPA
jgi:uncharacterized repeat protein (TIGR01451 family)